MDYMPENCERCPFPYWTECESISRHELWNWCPWYNCITNDINGGHEHRMSGCPLREITESE